MAGMVELLRTNDVVLVSFAESLLTDAGIPHSVADTHMSMIEGSLGFLPKRVLVAEDRYDDARELLIEAGVKL
jgi:hypothetical protein